MLVLSIKHYNDFMEGSSIFNNWLINLIAIFIPYIAIAMFLLF